MNLSNSTNLTLRLTSQKITTVQIYYVFVHSRAKFIHWPASTLRNERKWIHQAILQTSPDSLYLSRGPTLLDQSLVPVKIARDRWKTAKLQVPKFISLWWYEEGPFFALTWMRKGSRLEGPPWSWCWLASGTTRQRSRGRTRGWRRADTPAIWGTHSPGLWTPS